MEDYKMAVSKLCELQVQLLHHWLTVDQVIRIIKYFPSYEYLRVIAATTMLGRLLDIENIYQLLDQFTDEEEEEFLWRVGPLNCYNPMHPDRFYSLD
ncbi:unnamed protein product, partial [Choristocarpus tenellus]